MSQPDDRCRGFMEGVSLEGVACQGVRMVMVTSQLNLKTRLACCSRFRFRSAAAHSLRLVPWRR